jgi:hypothetical protein
VLRTEVARAPQRITPAQFLCYIALSQAPRSQYPPTALSDYDFCTAKRRHYYRPTILSITNVIPCSTRSCILQLSPKRERICLRFPSPLLPLSHLLSCHLLALTACRRRSFERIDSTDSDSVPSDLVIPVVGWTTMSHFPPQQLPSLACYFACGLRFRP